MRGPVIALVVVCCAVACGEDEPFAPTELADASGGGGGSGSGGGAGSGGAWADAAPPKVDAPTDAGLACAFEHEVTLPGHEGQFFGNASAFCRTFIAGIPNKPLVVVGSDAAGVGDHDCVLGRAVRYHVDWGDGTCTWTPRHERCDVRVGVEHTYDKTGTYTAWVFAEDDAGLRTRENDKVFEVHAQGGDVMVGAVRLSFEGQKLKFTQTVGAYGTLQIEKLTLAYRLQECDGKETELKRVEYPLPANWQASHQTLTTSQVELDIPPGVSKGRVVVAVDPDDTITETCPPSGNPPNDQGLNNLAAVDLASCPMFH